MKLFHVFTENSKIHLVFEFIDRTLLDVIRAAPNRALGAGERTKSYSFQLLRALAFVHSRNVW